MQNEYDIVIIGGGMVGATLAVALKDSHYRVAVIESHPLGSVAQPSYDDRSVALSYGSSKILQQIQLWPALEQRVAKINRIHVSDRGHFGVTRIDAHKEGVAALGYVVENRVFGEALFAQLAASASVDVISPATLALLEYKHDAVLATVVNNGQRQQLRCRLLVAADGATSAVRRLLNIEQTQTAYKQTAIIGNITPQQAHQGVAYERFTETGPLAMLPMLPHSDGSPRCTFVWTLAAAQAAEVEALDEQVFLQRLQQRFGYRLGRLLKVGKRSAFPLSLVQSATRIAERTVFIGNAAQTLHPVAGQGFNLALRDLATLLQCLLPVNRPDDLAAIDPGSAELLAEYADLRRTDQQRVITFTDQLVKIFSNAFPPLAHARALALSALDIMPVCRRQLAKHSMGLALPLAKIALPKHKE